MIEPIMIGNFNRIYEIFSYQVVDKYTKIDCGARLKSKVLEEEANFTTNL